MYYLQTLGGAVLRGSDWSRISLRSRKHLGLLLYLASHPRRPQSRIDLIQLFWDSHSRLARHSLSQALYDLRRNLSPIDFSGRTGILEVDTKRLLKIDTLELEMAIREGNLSAALDLCRGDFAPNLQNVGTALFERWLEAERGRFRTLAQTALRQYLSQSEKQGQWSDACLCALRLIKLDRFDEQAHYSLMKSLWLQGDQHSALEHYQTLEDSFASDLNRPLSAVTRRLKLRMIQRPTQSEREASVHGLGAAAIPLIGRDSEFGFLSSKLRGETRGGAFLIVRGEAGIGKSRLLNELEKMCAIDAIQVLKSKCYAAESSVPYGPVFDAVPELRKIVEGQGMRDLPADCNDSALSGSPDTWDQAALNRRWLFEEVARCLRGRCRKGHVAWIIEDVQWLDSASAALLHFILRRLRDDTFALIVSVRRESDIGNGAQVLLTSLEHPNRSLLEVGPLGEKALISIAETVAPGMRESRFVRLAVSGSGGNPLYLLELLRVAASQEQDPETLELKDAIGEGLRSVLLARLESLSTEAALVVEGAAVLEDLATLALLSQVTGMSKVRVALIVEELEACSLLAESGSRTRFVHEVFREFVYSTLGGLKRSALHMSAAESLAATDLAESPTLARHCAMGGDRQRAFDYAMQAVKETMVSREYSEAAEMASLAREMASDEEARIAALCLLARARLAAGHLEGAAQQLQDLLRSPQFEVPERRVEAHLDLLRAQVESCAWKAARVSSTTLIGQVARVANRELRVLLDLERLYEAIRLSVCLQDESEAHRHHQALREQYRLVKEADLLPTQATVTALLGQAFYATFLTSCKTALHLLSGLCLDSLSELDCKRVHHVRGLIAARLGAWDEAQRTISLGIALAERHKDVASTAALTNNLACLALEQGEWSLADNMCDRSATHYASINVDGLPLVPILLNRASSMFYQGNARAALRQYRGIEALYACDYEETDVWQVDLYMSLGLVLAQLGEAPGAKYYLSKVTDRCPASPFILQERFKYEWLRAYRYLIDGDLETAQLILAASADDERDKDVVSSAKLGWLACLISSCRSGSGERTHAERELRRLGLDWFAAFSTRWLRLALRTTHRGLNGSADCLPSQHASRWPSG